jgi:hypothetical protein
LELSFLLEICLVMSRPCCPVGQPGLAEEFASVSRTVLDAIVLLDVVEQQLCRPGLLLVAEFGRDGLEVFEQLISLVGFEFRGTAWSLFIIRGVLDRFLSEPIQPVADGFLDNIVTFSKSH